MIVFHFCILPPVFAARCMRQTNMCAKEPRMPPPQCPLPRAKSGDSGRINSKRITSVGEKLNTLRMRQL